MMTPCRSLLKRVQGELRAVIVGQRMPLALTMLTLLLAGLPAHATNYLFPGALPPGCTDAGSGNYACGTLTLIAGDQIAIAAPTPATINFSGAFTVGAGTYINATGNSADLTINAGAAVTLGLNVNLNGNIISSAAVTTGGGSTINGYILTSLPTGVVTIGSYNLIGADIKTDGGAVTIGDGSTIEGSISTAAGVVAIGADSTINGSVSTDAGGITTSTDVTITGSIGSQIDAVRAGIGTQAGVVTIGARNNINGMLSTNAGAITVGADSTIGGASTPTGVITLGARVTSGDIVSGAGAINIGDDDLLCGRVEAYGAGIVTVTSNVKIDGSISTTAGAITVGAGSSVGGNVTITGAGVVTMTSVLVAGNINTIAGAINLTGSRVRGSVAASGAGIVTLTGTTQNDKDFTIVAACAASPPPSGTTSVAAATFDAVETGVLWNSTAAAHNPLYTKLAGTVFSFDIAALKTDRTLESAYVTVDALAKHVKLELFDDTEIACSAYASSAAVAAQTASFAPALLSGVAGRAPSGAFTVADAHRSLLVRIRECSDSTCASFTGTAPACSSDRFSIRPSALTLSTTTSIASAVAPMATASQTIRAGADFTLLASSKPTAAYANLLTLDTSKLTAQLPSNDAGVLSGGAIGVLTPSTLTANAANAVNATYSEAGYLYIGPGAYRDDQWTRVDRNFGDCITSTLDQAHLSDALIGGKYGCSIGNLLTVRLGRFIPDHFSTTIIQDTASVKNTVMPCPAGLVCPPGPPPGFIYSGQPFEITIAALNVNGTLTRNYKDLLARSVMLEAWSAAGNTVLKNPPSMPSGSALAHLPVIATAFSEGMASASVTYTFPERYPAPALAAPTDIHLRAHETGADSNDVTSLRPAPSLSLEAGIKVVSGRLHLANNYGSELLAVTLFARAQYWDGTRFASSSTDQKTRFDSLNLTHNNCKKNLNLNGNCIDLKFSVPAQVSLTTSTSKTMTNGAIRLLLAAPGKTGSVDLRIDMFDWLPSTTARIGVGIYKAGPVIYMREMY